MRCFEDYIFFPPPPGYTPIAALIEFIQFYVEKEAVIGMILPSFEIYDFFTRVVESLSSPSMKNIRLILLDRSSNR